MEVRLLERRCNGCSNTWMATEWSMQEFCSKACEIINGNRSGQWGKEKKRKRKEPPKGAPVGHHMKIVVVSTDIVIREHAHPNDVIDGLHHGGSDEDDT